MALVSSSSSSSSSRAQQIQQQQNTEDNMIYSRIDHAVASAEGMFYCVPPTALSRPLHSACKNKAAKHRERNNVKLLSQPKRCAEGPLCHSKQMEQQQIQYCTGKQTMHQHWQQERFAVSAEMLGRSYVALASNSSVTAETSTLQSQPQHTSAKRVFACTH